MKNFNWLIKMVFYKHKEKKAELSKETPGVFYEVGYVDQLHTNLCTNASESMLNHFYGRPFATMDKNPRGILEGSIPNSQDYKTRRIWPDEIKNILEGCGPFILALPLKYGLDHSVVVTGCTKDQVIYNDPLTGCHKMISIEALKNLYSGKSGKIEIATERSANKNLMSKIKTILPDPPSNIIPKKYQKFFTLDKMDNPCEAVLNFLKDYLKFSITSEEHHKKEVSAFVERNKDNGLHDLLLDLNKTFPKDAINSQSELLKRLLTIEKIINKKEHTTEIEHNQRLSY